MKKTLTRVLSTLLVVMLLLGMSSALATGDTFRTKLAMVHGMDRSYSEWLSTDVTRASLVVCVLVDCISDGAPELYTTVMAEALAHETVYVALTDTQLVVEFYGEQGNITVYIPSMTGLTGGVYFSESTWSQADSFMKYLHDQNHYPTYYKVDCDTVYSLLSALVGD